MSTNLSGPHVPAVPQLAPPPQKQFGGLFCSKLGGWKCYSTQNDVGPLQGREEELRSNIQIVGCTRHWIYQGPNCARRLWAERAR